MSSLVTGIGISVLLLFVLPTILNFYSITIDKYGPYLAFMIFIIISSFILPHNLNSVLTSEKQ